MKGRASGAALTAANEIIMTSTQNSNADVSLVVVSHDGFADVWPGFFKMLFRHWPDRPYPLYLISNAKTFDDARVTPLLVGDDRSWSQTLAAGLQRISTPYVLLTLEDFYLTAPVDSAALARLHQVMVDSGGAYLRVMANPKPDQPHPDRLDIGLISPGAPYRTSTQMAFWDRAALLSLLREEKSAWDFELKGSRRSDKLPMSFLSISTASSPITYRHVVYRGKWLPDAIRDLEPLGLTFDLSKRLVVSRAHLRWQQSLPRRLAGRIWTALFRRQ